MAEFLCAFFKSDIGTELVKRERIVRCKDCRMSFEECGDLWCRGIVGPPIEPDGFCAWGDPREGEVMAEKRRIKFERYTNLPLGGNWAGEWPAYVLVHHEGSVDDVRYVPERTCRYVYDEGLCGWVCSECGGLEPVGDHVRYCPDCGARIEEEADE